MNPLPDPMLTQLAVEDPTATARGCLVAIAVTVTVTLLAIVGFVVASNLLDMRDVAG